jgi:uncharacterized protein YecE (DUF72 family)
MLQETPMDTTTLPAADDATDTPASAVGLATGTAQVRVGIGGWTFEPWRNNFYPAGLPHAQELHHASRQLKVIEVNGTYYSLQKPAVFAKWRDETPDGFVFSLKAPRFATNRRVLAEAGEAVSRFVQSGLVELGDKLGPIVWQFAPTKAFDATDFGTFLGLLPREVAGLSLRHAMDVRHASFRCEAYLALARQHRVTTVFTDSDDYPPLPDITGDFVYCRLMRTREDLPEGCTPAVLDQLAACAQVWQAGGEPLGLPRVAEAPTVPAGPREVFLFFISGAKVRAPAAAMALQRRLG